MSLKNNSIFHFLSSGQLLANPKITLKFSFNVIFICVVFLLLLAACGSAPEKKPVKVSPFNYVDSTLYFAERQSSISLRAVFNREQSKGLTEGYRFQFRTISSKPVFLSSISIIAGGKRLFLEEGQVVLPNQKGITLQLSLEESNFIASYPSALVQFRHNNESHIFAIELHQLKEFTP